MAANYKKWGKNMEIDFQLKPIQYKKISIKRKHLLKCKKNKKASNHTSYQSNQRITKAKLTLFNEGIKNIKTSVFEKRPTF